MVARAVRAAQGLDGSMAQQAAFMRLRTIAMPDGAQAAAVRVVAELDFDARVELAKRFKVANVPLALSAWGDVVDDLALVAVLRGESQVAARNLAKGVGGILARIARSSWGKKLLLAPVMNTAKVSTEDDRARVVVVVGPRRLRKIVARLLLKWGAR